MAPIKRLLVISRGEIAVRTIRAANEMGITTVAAFSDAAARGSGVIALDGRMIDAPVVARARKTIALAKAAGSLPGEVHAE